MPSSTPPKPIDIGAHGRHLASFLLFLLETLNYAAIL
jgi:hypothetical protein